MATRDRPAAADDGPDGPGDWIVTFSDCMTLLLCFFVMLLTFSSFEKRTLKRLSGAFEGQSVQSIFPHRKEISESMLPRVDAGFDATDKGSEMPTDGPKKMVRSPRKPKEIPDIGAYKPRKTLYIPAENMFWGRGAVLKGQGTEYLDMIASFVKVKPCLVIINESREGVSASSALERPWRILEYLVNARGLPAERLSIIADGGAVARRRFGGRPVIEISLVAERAYR